jgi:DNA-binding NtrC family response regulator
MAIIAFNSVSKAYQDKTVLHDFSLVVEPDQRVVILGPSGCGKTTVLRLRGSSRRTPVPFPLMTVSSPPPARFSSRPRNAIWAWYFKTSPYGRT